MIAQWVSDAGFLLERDVPDEVAYLAWLQDHGITPPGPRAVADKYGWKRAVRTIDGPLGGKVRTRVKVRLRGNEGAT